MQPPTRERASSLKFTMHHYRYIHRSNARAEQLGGEGCLPPLSSRSAVCLSASVFVGPPSAVNSVRLRFPTSDPQTQEGQFQPVPAGKYCVTVPIILAAIYAVIRAMLYCIWLSDHAVEASYSSSSSASWRAGCLE